MGKERIETLVNALREWSENSERQLFMYDETECDQLCLVEDVESLLLDQLNEIECLNVALSNMVRTSEGGIGHFYSIDEFYEARTYADQLLKGINK